MPFHFRRAIRVLPARQTVQQEVDQELRFHIDSRVEELAGAGIPLEQARAQAQREFGDLSAARQELARMDRDRETRRARVRWWSDLGTDVRLALRTLARRPGFVLTVLVTLALGIGANAAIFSVIDAALLRRLPFRQPDRLVHLWETYGPGGEEISEASFPDFLDWRVQSTAFVALAGYDETNVTVTRRDGAAMLRGARVTAGFFPLLGVAPALGRTFAPGEDGPGGSDVVLLADRYWRHALGADPAVVGRTLGINHRPYTIIGVLPAGFRFAPAGDAELWLPVDRRAATRAQRRNHWLRVVARLRDGVSVQAANRDLATVMARLAADHPETNRGRGVRVVTLREQVAGDLRPALFALLTAVGVLLLVACFNVAGLVLTRSLTRQRELGVRAAVGATRGRLIRLLLTESTVLAAAGALVGFLAAQLGVRDLVAAVPEGMLDQMAYLRDVHPNGVVLLFTAGLTVFTALGCGLAPAWLASRVAVPALLGGGGGRATGGAARGRTRDLLVAGQLALSVLLLIGGALVGRSLLKLVREDAGFTPDRLLTARVPLAGPAYAQPAAQQRFFETLMARLRALPGVRSVGGISKLPLNGGSSLTYRVEGLPEPSPSGRPEVLERGVAGDYFQALDIPLIAGRAFDARDDSTAPGAIIINRSLAEKLFPRGDAVGRRFRFYALPDHAWRIIGVVGDVKTGTLDGAPPPTVYFSHLQAAENRLTLTIRAAISPAALGPAVRAAVRSMDPGLPVYQVATMAEVVTEARPAAVRRYSVFLIGAFGITAFLLALTGVYGIVALSVTQRVRELGIRAALGATRFQLLGVVLQRAAGLIVVGLVAGCGLAFGLTRFLTTLLYHTAPVESGIFIGAVLALGVAAVTAAAIPAARATATDPAAVLRGE